MDFGSFGSKGNSMRRKPSSSLLQALSKTNTSRVSAIPIPSQTPTTISSNSHSDESHIPPHTPYSPDDNFSNYSHSANTTTAQSSRTRAPSFTTANGSRNVSSTLSSGHGSGREDKRLEDVIGLARDRLLNWSYLMQWYGGDTHWLNTVKVRRELVERELGPGKLDQRARQYFILGTSLAMLFEITVAGDFLRALQRLLDEWEYYCEKGAKGMVSPLKSLFRTQKAKRDKGEILESESYLVFINLPFTPDFFSVHATTCSVIRDIYKKMMGMLLPNTDAPLPVNTGPPAKHSPDGINNSPTQSLLHPSTFILSAPTELVLRANPHLSASLAQQICSGSGLRGDTESLYSTPTAMQYSGSGEYDSGFTAGRAGGRDTPFGESAAGYAPDNGTFQRDAFEALMKGELPSSHSLVGDGQQITPQILDTFVKVDTKLKKQFNLLVKEGDHFARKTLDEEIAVLLSSLSSPTPMQFDYEAALSGMGNGWQPSPPRSVSVSNRQQYSNTNQLSSEPTSASTANFSITTSGGAQRHPSLSQQQRPVYVRQGSSDQSQEHQRQAHPWARRSIESQRNEELAESIEEHVKDEHERPNGQRERDFGAF